MILAAGEWKSSAFLHYVNEEAAEAAAREGTRVQRGAPESDDRPGGILDEEQLLKQALDESEDEDPTQGQGTSKREIQKEAVGTTAQTVRVQRAPEPPEPGEGGEVPSQVTVEKPKAKGKECDRECLAVHWRKLVPFHPDEFSSEEEFQDI
jgi:hypothetical protein